MRLQKIINQKGFTIIELIISISIFTVLIFVVLGLFLNVFSQPEQNIIAMDMIDQACIITSGFTNEIRNAAVGNDGSYPLNQASNSEIIFYSNYGSSGTAVNRIRYYLSNNNLYKGVVVPTGSPLVYNLALETVTTLMSGLENASAPVFYYYGGDFNGSGSPLLQPINVNEVKFVKINLMVQRHTTENSNDTFLVNAGAAVRNLKDNLGN